MRVKQSRSRTQKASPAPLPQRRRAKRRMSTGARGAPPAMVEARAGNRTPLQPMQWMAFIAIGLISIALIVLIWTLASRAIADQESESRARSDQYVRSVAFVLAREIQDELLLVDQSLAIVQDAWKKDSASVDLPGWKNQLLALTNVANDIFIANEKGVIVQGTLPQAIGQGFGSAYVTYPNGSLEMFDADGKKNPEGKIPGADRVEARQFLMYVARPLDQPRGWFIGASYRSEGITKLFAGARLGQDGLVGLTDVKRGSMQAIVGSTAQFAEMDIAQSELVEQMRKNESGVWAGISPMDHVPRIIAYQRVAGRDTSVVVGIATQTANLPLAGLAAMARALAFVGSVLVVAVAAIFIWSIATAAIARQRKRTHEHTELNLLNARQEIAVARARMALSEPEVGTLLSSSTDGVARLDGDHRLRVWNQRFAELAGVPLDPAAPGMPAEDLLRRQAQAGLFGEADSEDEIGKRLTILHTAGQSVVPPTQSGPGGQRITMHVRGVVDGGRVIVLETPENARYAALPPLAVAGEPETADETTEW